MELLSTEFWDCLEPQNVVGKTHILPYHDSGTCSPLSCRAHGGCVPDEGSAGALASGTKRWYVPNRYKDIKMTLRYAHLAPYHMLNAVNRLDNVLNEKAEVYRNCIIFKEANDAYDL